MWAWPFLPRAGARRLAFPVFRSTSISTESDRLLSVKTRALLPSLVMSVRKWNPLALKISLTSPPSMSWRTREVVPFLWTPLK